MENIIPEFPLQSKQCPGCNTDFPTTKQFFQSDQKRKDGLSRLCKTCLKDQRKLQPRTPREKLPEGQKRCPKCKQILAANLENFGRNRNEKSGLTTYCKECMYAPYRKPSTEEEILPEGTKRCTQCLQCKPATADFFVKSSKIKDGWEGRCKECKHANWRVKHPPKREKPPEGCRRCVTCHEIYPATTEHFAPSKRKYDKGLRPQCRKCRAKEWKEYNDAHVEDHKQYYQEHREEISQKNKLHYQANWIEIRRRERQRYKTYGVEYGRKYRKTHAEAIRVRSNNRNARKKSVPGTYTLAQIREQLKRQRYRCYYAACGYAKFKKVKGRYVYHIEHTFPITREGARNDISHLVLACPTCNLRKGNKYPHEWPEGGRLM